MQNILLRTSIVAFFLAIPCQVLAAYTTEFDQERGMIAGRGYDTLSATVKGDCVSREGIETVSAGEGQQVQFNLTRIEDYSQLAKFIDFDASASFGADSFTAKGKASFFESIAVNQYNLYILVSVRVKNSSSTLVGSVLTDSARALLTRKGAEAFRKRCGDVFLSTYTTGGEYLGLIEIHTKDETEKRSIEGQISGAYGAFSGSAEFKSQLTKISKRNNVNIHVYRAGDSGVIEISPDKFIAEAASFPEKVMGAKGHIYRATFFEYENLELPDGPDLVDVEIQTDIIQKLSELRLSTIYDISNVGYVLSYPKEFEEFDETKLLQDLHRLENNINMIYSATRECRRDISGCMYPTSIDSIKLGLPKRREIGEQDAATQIEAAKRKEEIARKKALEAETREREANRLLEEARKKEREAEKRRRDAEIAAQKAEEEAKRIEEEARQKEAEARRREEEARQREAEARRKEEEARRSLAEAQRKAEEAEKKRKEAEDAAALILGGPGVAATKKLIESIF